MFTNNFFTLFLQGFVEQACERRGDESAMLKNVQTLKKTRKKKRTGCTRLVKAPRLGKRIQLVDSDILFLPFPPPLAHVEAEWGGRGGEGELGSIEGGRPSKKKRKRDRSPPGKQEGGRVGEGWQWFPTIRTKFSRATSSSLRLEPFLVYLKHLKEKGGSESCQLVSNDKYPKYSPILHSLFCTMPVEDHFYLSTNTVLIQSSLFPPTFYRFQSKYAGNIMTQERETPKRFSSRRNKRQPGIYIYILTQSILSIHESLILIIT